MDSGTIFGIGISAVSAFIRWRIPKIPNPLATAGCVIGIGFIFLSQFPTEINWMSAVIFVVIAIIAATIDWMFSPKKGKAMDGDQSKPEIDQKVISLNQSGGITARNVNIGIPEPNVLYQDGRRVATVVNGMRTDKENEIIFGEIRFTDSADTTRPLDFQGVKLMCDTPSVVSEAAIFSSLFENVRCRIVGKR